VGVVEPKGVRTMKLDEKALANASAIFTGIIYLFCAGAVAFFPGISKIVAGSWFHGIDIGLIWTGGARSNFLLGLISAVGLTWLSGWIFAWLYNKLVR